MNELCARARSECLTRCTRSARGPEPCWNETFVFAPAAEPLALHLELLEEPSRTNVGEVCSLVILRCCLPLLFLCSFELAIAAARSLANCSAHTEI